MLSNERLPITDAENEAVEKLLDGHGGNASLTRRDPGETGPLLVHLADATFEVAADGKTREVK